MNANLNFLSLNLLLYLYLIIPGSCSGSPVRDPEITVTELRQHVEYLSSDALAGRYPGTEGDRLAAFYIRDQFKKSGLELEADNGFQYFSLTTGISTGEKNCFTAGSHQAEFLSDFTPFPFSESSRVTAEVIFCGYGFSINEYDFQWNDYEGVDVDGKWVMVLRGDPEPEDASSIFATHSDDRWKSYLAAEKGAAGMIMVSGKQYDRDDRLVETRIHQGKVSIPVIQVKRPLADIILSESSTSLEMLEQRLLNELRPFSFKTNSIVTASTDVIVNEARTMNVIGSLRGNDPLLKNEHILIGAHYDHLGTGGDGSSSRSPGTESIHPGADDNASGVAAMIEIAEKLSSGPDLPGRSFLFVAFGAEEKGLLGSGYFTENPVVDLGSVKTMINLDMVGRKNEERMLQAGGVGTSIESESIINSLNSEYGFNITWFHEGFGPSDHASFYARDIPVFFFSTGAHPDYHTPEDMAEKINYNGLQTISRFVYELAAGLGNMDRHLTFQEAGPRTPATPRHGGRRVTLGIMPDFTTGDGEGLRADFVSPGRPAEQGGMKKGDVIVAINGNPVKDIYEYMYRMEQLSKGDIINIEVLRDGKSEILIIHL